VDEVEVHLRLPQERLDPRVLAEEEQALEGRVVDARARRELVDLERGRGRFVVAEALERVVLRVHLDDDELLHAARLDGSPEEAVGPPESDPEPADAGVVGDPAIREMQVSGRIGALDVATLVARPLAQARVLLAARRLIVERSRRREAGSRPLELRVVAHRDRREGDRERRARHDGARDREAREVGAEEVELVLRELEALARRQVRRVHEHEGPRAEGRERRVVEDRLVVELGDEVAPLVVVGRPEPPGIPYNSPLDLSLEVALEDARREGLEEALAVERERGGGEGAARDGGDAVHLVEEPLLLALPDDLGLAEPLEHRERELRRARPAPREREADEERVRVLRAALELLEAVAALRLEALGALVHEVVRTPSERERDEEREPGPHGSQSGSHASAALVHPRTTSGVERRARSPGANSPRREDLSRGARSILVLEPRSRRGARGRERKGAHGTPG